MISLKSMMGFMMTMMRMKPWWVAWVMVLMAANMIAPLFFLESWEARLTLIAFAIGAMAQMAIYDRLGWVRLLGAGHFAWLVLVPWLWSRYELVPPDSLFARWMLAVIVLNAISIVIDAIETGRYLRGARQPTIAAKA